LPDPYAVAVGVDGFARENAGAGSLVFDHHFGALRVIETSIVLVGLPAVLAAM
jgi:hypothetical protein